MGDVAQILDGTQAKASVSIPRPPPPPASHQPSKAMQVRGMSREVVELISGNQDAHSAALPPIIPTFNKDDTTAGDQQGISVKVGNKWISSSKPARKWAWAPFVSSSRTDGLSLSVSGVLNYYHVEIYSRVAFRVLSKLMQICALISSVTPIFEIL